MINRKKFSTKSYLIWRYAELNCLLAGSGLISLNIEDDRTVWYSHTDGKGNTQEFNNISKKNPNKAKEFKIGSNEVDATKYKVSRG